ncbi:MAG: hypothetical protein ACRDGE_06450 [Candidatus Limnocylindria bacterium]
MSAEDRLREIQLPAELRTGAGRCELLAAAEGTYDLRSRGPLGGRHGTLFRPEGDIAHLVGVGKIGWFGSRVQHVPPERHVQALRELGFTEMSLSNGERYEIRRGWPGVRRVSE